MKNITILHLSDIHIKSASDPILTVAKKIATAAYEYARDARLLFIVISGDIAFSGAKGQYDLAAAFLKEIKANLEVELKCNVEFIVAPGNHDCNFNSSNGTRNILVELLANQNPPQVDDSIIESCLIVQSEFEEFREQIESVKPSGVDRLWSEYQYNVDGTEVIFDVLNISWISQLNENKSLYFPIHRYSRREWRTADLRLLVFHHPLNWYAQAMYQPFRSFVRRMGNIVMTGHEHQGNVGINDDTESGKSAYLEGCVLQNEGTISDSCFYIVCIDLDGKQYKAVRVAWNGNLYAKVDDGSWSSYRDLPAKENGLYSLQESFLDVLEDTGAYFWRGSRDIALSDIYVYPDLSAQNFQDEREARISAQTLLQPKAIVGGVIISGDEKSGRSSLLHQLFRSYHQRGYFPVLIDARRLKNLAGDAIDEAIRSAVSEQYGPARVESFQQQPRSAKLLLVDNFDDSHVAIRSRSSALLKILETRFAQYVITVGEGFEIRELTEGDADGKPIKVRQYKLQPFGYVLRAKLIEKWFRLPGGDLRDATEMAGLCDRAEKIMNSAMARGVIPSVPLYLLTLLQSIEGGHSGEFRESALGHYYQFLMSEALQKKKVKPDRLTEIFQYCTQLAWFFHLSKADELDQSDLRKFNESFCREWHTVDFRERLDLLTAARILTSRDERYSFRYPYVYYYFKGQYLSDNLSSVQIREYISRCCSHLYVKDYANTVLFLVHHTNDDYVLQSIAEALRGLFRERAPITFIGDTGPIRNLIESAPKLLYSGGKPEEHRIERSRVRDELEKEEPLLLDEQAGGLSLGCQLTMMSKTVQILGQVLKNQYSRIPRKRKGELLRDLFDAPLRAVADLVAYCETSPDVLINEIDQELRRRSKVSDDDKRRKIAKRVVAMVIEMCTWGLVMHAVEAVSSDDLKEDIHEAAQKNNSLAYRLIELAIELDSPKALPRRKIKELNRDVGQELVPSRLLRLAVLQRLYMFRTTENDMLWLNGELDFDMSVQRRMNEKRASRRLK